MRLRPRPTPIAMATLFSDSGINWDLYVTGQERIDAAPLTDPYIGKHGAAVVVETDGAFGADGTKIDITIQSTASWGDQYIRDNVGRTRERGRIAAGRIIHNATNAQIHLGLSTSTVLSNDEMHSIKLGGAGELRVKNLTASPIQIGISIVGDDQIDWIVIARAVGAYLLASVNGGSWQLLYWFDTDSTATLYAGITSLNAAGSLNLLGSVVVPESLVPSPVVSDNFPILTIADSGSNGLDGTPVRVGLDGSAGHFNRDIPSVITLPDAAIDTAGFDGAEYTMLIRLKVKDLTFVAVGEHFIDWRADSGSRLIILRKSVTSGDLGWVHINGATTSSVAKSLSDTGFVTMALTVSESAGVDGQFKAYYGDTSTTLIQEGSTQTAIGTWSAAVLDAGNAVLGTGIGLDTPSSIEISDFIVSLNSGIASLAQLQTLQTELDAGTLAASDIDNVFGANNWLWLDFSERYATDGLGHTEADGQGSGKNRDGRTWSSAGNKRYNGAAGGADVILTGDFASDSDWDKGTGWAIAAGIGSKTAGTGSDLGQTVDPLTSGLWYKLTYTVSGRTAGTITPKFGTAAGVARSTNATFTEIVRANAAAFDLTADSSFDGDVDDVIVVPIVIADLLDLTNTGQSNHYMATNATIIADTQGGGCVAADSTKQDFINVYYDRTDNKVKADKYIAGVLDTAAIISVSKTYSAAAGIRIKFTDINADETYDLVVIYNDVFVATVTVSDAAIVGNTYVGEIGFLEGGFAEKEVVYLGNETTKYDAHFVGVT